MAKTLVILILLFNGDVLHGKIDFNPPTDDCFGWGQAHIEAIATYVRPGPKQGWYLNDGRGTVQGFYCE